ncbi:MAG: dUTP diphosphatase [Bacilli bacterium]|nr:dUTP diphosphatase [Bacilli bacterium]
MKLDLTKLFECQKELDATIAKNHNISYENTKERRIMALLVEVGELANATRCFKFWSNKPSEPKEIVLDEFADGLHFLLSLGLIINVSNKTFSYKKKNVDLTSQFLEVYKKINEFRKKQTETSYRKAFISFLELLPILGYKGLEAVDAYYLKLDVNYKRQQNNY